MRTIRIQSKHVPYDQVHTSGGNMTTEINTIRTEYQTEVVEYYTKTKQPHSPVDVIIKR